MPELRYTPGEQLGLDVRDFARLKLMFFEKHSYTGGDRAPLPPVVITVKRDERGAPTECHVRPWGVALQQADCALLLLMLEELRVAPLLAAKPVRVDGVKMVYLGVPEALDDAVTLLEDLPFPVEAGVLAAVAKPPVEELEAGALRVYPYTGVVVTPDGRHPAVLLATPVPGWREMRRRVAALLAEAREWPPGRREWLQWPEWRRLQSRLERRLESVLGRTVTLLRASDEPRLYIYPLILE